MDEYSSWYICYQNQYCLTGDAGRQGWYEGNGNGVGYDIQIGDGIGHVNGNGGFDHKHWYFRR